MATSASSKLTILRFSSSVVEAKAKSEVWLNKSVISEVFCRVSVSIVSSLVFKLPTLMSKSPLTIDISGLTTCVISVSRSSTSMALAINIFTSSSISISAIRWVTCCSTSDTVMLLFFREIITWMVLVLRSEPSKAIPTVESPGSALMT